MADSELTSVSSDSSADKLTSNTNSIQIEPNINMRILQSLIWFVKDHFNQEVLTSLSFKSGVPLKNLKACKGWISLEQAETVLEFVRELAGSEETFMIACVYKMKESYGPLRFLLWATTPDKLLESGQKHFSTISTFSKGEVDKIGRGKFRLKYFSEREESKLMCLSRQAQSVALPTLWGLPEASLLETKCICNGDTHCEYELLTYNKSRLLPILLGLLIGLLASVSIYYFNLWPKIANIYLWGIAPLIGATLGYIFELKKASNHNLHIANDINEGLSKIVIENQETQQEIQSLHQRQKNWSRKLEHQVNMQITSNKAISEKLQSILTEQTTAIKGVSHDIKNPLTVILQTAELMVDDLSQKNKWMIEEQKVAVDRIRSLLGDMLQLENKGISAIKLVPEIIPVKPLEDSLRKRLIALSGDHHLKTTVISTKNIPGSITIDKVILNRIIDNLLTNAIKYTARGSILLEIDGKPGFLTVKLSDTGRGIAEEDMKKIFIAEGSDPSTRGKDSQGLGLSVVVRLLGRIGGELELMSQLNHGSTFWVHFPVIPLEQSSLGKNLPVTLSDLTDKVVTIRKTI